MQHVSMNASYYGKAPMNKSAKTVCPVINSSVYEYCPTRDL